MEMADIASSRLLAYSYWLSILIRICHAGSRIAAQRCGGEYEIHH
jgi:hypothetical protein